MSAQKLTTKTFDSFVAANRVALVDFSASWCGPCKVMKPVLDKVAQEYQDRGAAVGIVDVDEQPALTSQFRISAVPTLVFFKDGKAAGILQGAVERATVTEQLEKLLQ